MSAGEIGDRLSPAREQVLGSIGGAEMSLMFVLILFKTDRLDAAERVLERELRAARQRGSLSIDALICTFRAAVASRHGALASAQADLRAGLDVLTPDAWQRAQLSVGLLDILVKTGEPAETQALLGAGGWDADLPDNRSANVLLASRSRLRVAQGDLLTRSSTTGPRCAATATAPPPATRCAAGSTSPPPPARGRSPSARHELGATGLRVRREAQTGIAALTPSARRIAEHAAGGATNPEIPRALFVTVKTVEMHVGNAYRKLDITSRHELARHLQAAAPE